MLISSFRSPVLVLVASLFSFACGDEDHDPEHYTDAELSIEIPAHEAQALVDCTIRHDTGYSSGNPFSIDVVDIDGKPVELDTANAFWVMKQAAAADGVNITIVSGFRTMSQQQYLYGCYVNCNCNNCNLAAQPGYSNHQSGHALDLNTSAPSVYNWLAAHAGAYGFSRTVPSEPWHWEWWGGGPGGGICGLADPECVANPNLDQCVGSVVRRCDDAGQFTEGDCGFFGAACSTLGGDAHCVHPLCFETGENSTFCTDDRRLATCELGQYSVGDCGAFGGTCSTAGQDHCVSYFCNAYVGAENGSACTDDDQLVVCSGGAHELINCGPGYGGSCVDDAEGARCVHPYCNVLVGGEDGTACTDDEQLVVCDGGAAEMVNCAPGYGGSCEEAEGDLPARCVHPYCNAIVGAETGSACTDDDQLIVCEDGAVEVINCAPGFGGSCESSGAGADDARCVHPYCNVFVGAETGSACTDANELIVCDGGDATLTACGDEPCRAQTQSCGEPPPPPPPPPSEPSGEGEGEGEPDVDDAATAGDDGDVAVLTGETGCAASPAGSPALLAVALALAHARRRRQ